MKCNDFASCNMFNRFGFLSRAWDYVRGRSSIAANVKAKSSALRGWIYARWRALLLGVVSHRLSPFSSSWAVFNFLGFPVPDHRRWITDYHECSPKDPLQDAEYY